MARPTSRPGLNEATQRELVWFLAKGYSKEDAAKRAGLSSSGRVSSFTRSREFAHALREGLLDHMAVELAPKAVRILDEIMSDEKVQHRVRVDAAKALLDRSGYPASVPGSKLPGDDSIAEMPLDRLKRLVHTLETAETAAAMTIDGELADPGKADTVAELFA